MNLFDQYYLVQSLLFLFHSFQSSISETSKLLKCADEKCRTLISKGRTNQKYDAVDNEKLSFLVDEVVHIYSKGDGDISDIWLAKIGNRQGYILKKMVIENDVFHTTDSLYHSLPMEAIFPKNSGHPLHSTDMADGETSGTNVVSSEFNVHNYEDLEFSTLEGLSKPQLKSVHDSARNVLNHDNVSRHSAIDSNYSDSNNFMKYSFIDHEENLLPSPRENSVVHGFNNESSSLSMNFSLDSSKVVKNSLPNIQQISRDIQMENEDSKNGNGEENGNGFHLQHLSDSRQSTQKSINGKYPNERQDINFEDTFNSSNNIDFIKIANQVENLSTNFEENSQTLNSVNSESHILGHSEGKINLSFSNVKEQSNQSKSKIGNLIDKGVEASRLSNTPSQDTLGRSLPEVAETSLQRNSSSTENVQNSVQSSTSSYNNINGSNTLESSVSSNLSLESGKSSVYKNNSSIVIDKHYTESRNMYSEYESISENTILPHLGSLNSNSSNSLIDEKSSSSIFSLKDTKHLIYEDDSHLKNSQRFTLNKNLSNEIKSFDESPTYQPNFKVNDTFLKNNSLAESVINSDSIIPPSSSSEDQDSSLNILSSSTTKDGIVHSSHFLPMFEDKGKKTNSELNDEDEIRTDNKEHSGSHFGVYQENVKVEFSRKEQEEVNLNDSLGNVAEPEFFNEGYIDKQEKRNFLDKKNGKLSSENINQSFDIEPISHSGDYLKYNTQMNDVEENFSSGVINNAVNLDSLHYIDPDFSDFTINSHQNVILNSSQILQQDQSQEAIDKNVSRLKDHFLSIVGVLVKESLFMPFDTENNISYLSRGRLVFLMVISSTVFFLYIAHMLFLKISRERQLLQMMNSLDRSHRILLEENNNFKKKEYCSTEQVVHITKMSELEERNKQLEIDLELSAASEEELNKMVTELLSSQNITSHFQESIDSLEKMLDSQREVVEGLTSDLTLKSHLNEELQAELKTSKVKIAKLEFQIEQLSHSLDEAISSKQQFCKQLSEEELAFISIKESNVGLRTEVDRLSEEVKNHWRKSNDLTNDLRKLKKRLSTKEAECQVAKECLKKLQVFSDSGFTDPAAKLSEVFNMVEVRSKLTSKEAEVIELTSELNGKCELVKSLQDQLSTSESRQNAQEVFLAALQKEKDDSLAKLSVLSSFYEEKEKQLKKELESQTNLLQNAEGITTGVSNRIKAYEIELKSYKLQIESLKNELEEQRLSHKIQLTNEEKKLHDSWLNVKAVERRQEGLRQENYQLRQQLSFLEKNSAGKENNLRSLKRGLDWNGSLPSPVPLENTELDGFTDLGFRLDVSNNVVPPFPSHLMLPPPPPLLPGLAPAPPPFLPPPPPPHLDRRLPPAGRMASPPANFNQENYSPTSTHSSYGLFSPDPVHGSLIEGKYSKPHLPSPSSEQGYERRIHFFQCIKSDDDNGERREQFTKKSTSYNLQRNFKNDQV